MPNGKDVPVIMLTSVQERRSVIESAKYGIYDYILKPFGQSDLRSRVRLAFAKAKAEADAAKEKKEEQ